MATVTGFTAARMLEIEASSVVDGSVVGDNLILEQHDGATINAGNVRGPAGYGADSDLATASWVNTGVNTRAALLTRDKQLWTPKKRTLGMLTECVIVGSSNAVTGTWGTEFCATWGLTQRNFAISGSGFTSPTNFTSQLQNAGASGTFVNADVALVVICDASNNVRQFNNTGTTVDILADAKAAFSYAKTTFPNARIVCLPVVWPADPMAQAAGVPGGYQSYWSFGLQDVVSKIQEAALLHGVEVVDYSWTWLTGTTGMMDPGLSVHPNAAGYTRIAQWLAKHLKGESTRSDSLWTLVPYLNATEIAGSLMPMRVRREGWNVFLNGSVKNTVAGSGGVTDVGLLPVGFKPVLGWEITARQNGSAVATACQIYPNGTMRFWGNSPVNTEYFISGGWTLS